MKSYTGVGSRETPPHIKRQMERIGYDLAKQGYTLRSGRADGADAAFQAGAFQAVKEGITVHCEIFVPWASFNTKHRLEPCWLWSLEQCPNSLIEQAKKLLFNVMHPTHWNACSRAARMLHSRNVFQVFGVNLEDHSDFLLYWAPTDKAGKPKGGTRTAVLLAEMCNIPTINMGQPNWQKELEKYVKWDNT